MPNYVTNIVEFNGPEEKVAELLAFIRGDEEDQLISFHKIIPRPEELGWYSSPPRREDPIKEHKVYSTYLFKKDPIKEHKVYPTYLFKKEEDIQETEEEFQARMERFQKEYGAKDWYDWCIENWGTKWDACDQGLLGENVIQFDTAWSTPVPVLAALSCRFPEVDIWVKYADENIGYNCGEYALQDGVMVTELHPTFGTDDACEFACKVKGWSWEEMKREWDEEDAEPVIPSEKAEVDN